MLKKELVIIGKIVGVHGIQGGLKVFSYTKPRINLFKHKNWQLLSEEVWQQSQLIKHQGTEKQLIAYLAGIENRDQAMKLMSLDIAIKRDDLPGLDANEYYWCDLQGLSVENKAGDTLGKVERLFATGANDVMVVKGDREYLIPFVQQQYIISINLEEQQIIVDWEKDYS